MSNDIQYGPWIDNEGAMPSLEVLGRVGEVEYCDGVALRIVPKDPEAWSECLHVPPYSLIIKKYRLEIEQSPAPEIETVNVFHPWQSWNGGSDGPEFHGAPLIQAHGISKTRAQAERSDIGRKKSFTWEKVIAYRTRIVPEVKVWSLDCKIQGVNIGANSGANLLRINNMGNSTIGIPVRITLAETNGKREWSISEVETP